MDGLGIGCVVLGLVTLGCLGCGSPASETTVYFDLLDELALSRQRVPAPANGSGDAPRARAEGDSLLIPPGVRVHYSLELPASARIVFEGVRPRGGKRGTLRLWVLPHGGETRLLAQLPGERDRTEIEWQAAAPQVVRLSLGVEKGRGGMVIRRPAIWVEPGNETAAETPGLDRRRVRRLRKVQRPNIVVYLIDSLRADRLGCYGYPKPVSPAIDAFANSALVFDNATANSSWTKSAVASIFTGLWPASHRAITREDKLPKGAFTLAEALQEVGYATVGFSTNPSIAEEFGFEQGFDDLTLLSRDTYAEEVTQRAAQWLRDFDGESPFFLYLHTLDPHDPYLPLREELERWAPGVPGEFAARSNKVVNRLNRSATGRAEAGETLVSLEALYDGEVAANDRAFGELMETLEKSGKLADAVIIVVADHGEDFGEHGAWRHGQRLTRESLQVPLLVRLPGEHRTGREPSLVQQVDILPTLLELLELEAPRPVEGESLLPLFVGQSRPAAADPAFVYVRFNPPTRFGVIWRDWKLVSLTRGDGRRPTRLFHLESDPEERLDVAGRFPVMRDFLQAMLARKLLDQESALIGERTEISPETRRALRALGYIQ
jgi:arylsulfatase A-like enzyme